MDNFEILQKLQLTEQLVVDEMEVQLDMLIGLDYYYALVTDEQIRFPNGIVILSTRLGYMATGCLHSDQSSCRKGTSMLISATTHAEVSHDWEKYWALEEIGIKEDHGLSDDDVAVAHFNDTVKFQNNRYHVRLPYKVNVPELPDNYALAAGRPRSLLNRRLKGNPDILDEYDKIIIVQIERGVVEKDPTIPYG